MEKTFDLDPAVHLAVVQSRLDRAASDAALWEAVARTTQSKLDAVTAELLRAIGPAETVSDETGAVLSD